ncbi:IAA-alanine resistance protein 1 [Nymphaea thermarum]|nr:IAA-alanine resistance protein 1 [Nymphaea thermarum]
MAVWTLLIFHLLAFSSLGETLAQQCGFSSHESPNLQDHHGHTHHHHHHHDHDNHLCGDEHHHLHDEKGVRKLPEELQEEEDLRSMGFSSYHHWAHDHPEIGSGGLSNLGLWIRAMGCSMLVSMASLICLILLPIFFVKGKPSKIVVDSLALFGQVGVTGPFIGRLEQCWEMLSSTNYRMPSHLDPCPVFVEAAGIVFFLLIEKIVRYVEGASGKEGLHHGHHSHHHRPRGKITKKHEETNDQLDHALADKRKSKSEAASETEILDGVSSETTNDSQNTLHKRRGPIELDENEKKVPNFSKNDVSAVPDLTDEHLSNQPSNLVFGYLNLFSDGVHNFTDGMALGSAFLLHGSVGGWSRTLFLLAHELPQEVGDFGILVRSGFSVFKALFFNFLSALVALAGTALALTLGQDPGHSSMIEGFTAGGFIYIAVAGVLPEMNSGDSSFRSTTTQLISLISGMSVALCISLYE